MEKYIVNVNGIFEKEFEVEANSKSEAKIKTFELFENSNLDDCKLMDINSFVYEP